MTKYSFKPGNKLKTIKAMFEYLGLNSEAVLSNWLMMFQCNGSLVVNLSVETKKSLFQDMLLEAGHDLDSCLMDWRYNYREKLDSKQIKAMEKINPDLLPKAFGIGL